MLHPSAGTQSLADSNIFNKKGAPYLKFTEFSLSSQRYNDVPKTFAYEETCPAVFLALSLASPTLSQKKPTVICGNVIDAFTHELIDKQVVVELLSPDSAVVDTAVSRIITDQGNGQKRTYWQMEIPEQATKEFILRFSCEGYDTLCKPAKLRWTNKGALMPLYQYLQLRRSPLK